MICQDASSISTKKCLCMAKVQSSEYYLVCNSPFSRFDIFANFLTSEKAKIPLKHSFKKSISIPRTEKAQSFGESHSAFKPKNILSAGKVTPSKFSSKLIANIINSKINILQKVSDIDRWFGLFTRVLLVDWKCFSKEVWVYRLFVEWMGNSIRGNFRRLIMTMFLWLGFIRG